MPESVQQKLARIRKPRVHITYDVETEGAIAQKELPFVVGVLGDFSGSPLVPLAPLRDRKFIQIDRDNFNDVMGRMNPHLSLKVENSLADDNSTLAVDLSFKSIEDFEPGRIVNQVEPLRKLLETRNKIDSSQDLEELLEKTLQSTDDINKLANELKSGELKDG